MPNSCKAVEMLSYPLWFSKDFSKHIQFLARRITYIWGKTCLPDAGGNIAAAAFSGSTRSSMRRFKHRIASWFKCDFSVVPAGWQMEVFAFLFLHCVPLPAAFSQQHLNSVSTELNSMHIIVSHFLHLCWCKSWILHVIPKQLQERKSPLNEKHLK